MSNTRILPQVLGEIKTKQLSWFRLVSGLSHCFNSTIPITSPITPCLSVYNDIKLLCFPLENMLFQILRPWLMIYAQPECHLLFPLNYLVVINLEVTSFCFNLVVRGIRYNNLSCALHGNVWYALDTNTLETSLM